MSAVMGAGGPETTECGRVRSVIAWALAWGDPRLVPDDVVAHARGCARCDRDILEMSGNAIAIHTAIPTKVSPKEVERVHKKVMDKILRDTGEIR